MADVVVSHRAL